MTTFWLTSIHIYPVKSLGGIALDTANVLKKGLQFDRRWMLIDENGIAMTQRTYPRMALFRPSIQGDVVRIDHVISGQTTSSTAFSISPKAGEGVKARVWDDQVDVCEVDPEVSGWFADHLGVNCRLVAFPEANSRPTNPKYAPGAQVSLADAYPFLIIGESSLNDLNHRLPEPVPMNRFRPNFVFSGGVPFEEDGWKNLTIGEISFAAVKKSDRCVLTTVDQETAVKGTEPLRTLSGYRRVGSNVFFGQNMISLKEGTVSVGDPIIPG